MNRGYRMWILLFAAAALSAWWWWIRKNASSDSLSVADASSTSNIPTGDNLAKKGISIGTIGSTLIQQDTKGNALATAVADLLGTGGNGEFSYVSPDFTLQASRFDVGNYTALKAMGTQGAITRYRAKKEQIVTLPGAQYKHGGAVAFANTYATSGGTKPGFNKNDASTFIIIPGLEM